METFFFFFQISRSFFCCICSPAVATPRAYKSNQLVYCLLTQFCSVSLCRTCFFFFFFLLFFILLLPASSATELYSPTSSIRPLSFWWGWQKVSEEHIEQWKTVNFLQTLLILLMVCNPAKKTHINPRGTLRTVWGMGTRRTPPVPSVQPPGGPFIM